MTISGEIINLKRDNFKENISTKNDIIISYKSMDFFLHK